MFYALVLNKQFSDLSTHSLVNILVFPASSVPQIGSNVMLQFVSHPFVWSRWPCDVFSRTNNARTGVIGNKQSVEYNR